MKRVPVQGDPQGVIYSWGWRSDHNAVSYEIILRRSGEKSCDCPSWRFKKKDQPRGCKHVDKSAPDGLGDQISEIWSLFQAGKPLPMNQVEAPPQKSQAYTPGDTSIRLRPRRMITID